MEKVVKKSPNLQKIFIFYGIIADIKPDWIDIRQCLALSRHD